MVAEFCSAVETKIRRGVLGHLRSLATRRTTLAARYPGRSSRTTVRAAFYMVAEVVSTASVIPTNPRCYPAYRWRSGGVLSGCCRAECPSAVAAGELFNFSTFHQPWPDVDRKPCASPGEVRDRSCGKLWFSPQHSRMQITRFAVHHRLLICAIWLRNCTCPWAIETLLPEFAI